MLAIPGRPPVKVACFAAKQDSRETVSRPSLRPNPSRSSSVNIRRLCGLLALDLLQAIHLATCGHVMVSMEFRRWITGVAIVLGAMSVSAQISPSSSTAFWTPIQYQIGNVPDPFGDQQTGSVEGDIVGDSANPSLYAAFDDGGTPGVTTDGEVGFRFRLGGDKNPSGFKGAAFVAMDLDGNGSLDLFGGVNNSGSAALIGLWWAGSSANTSPSTTTLANAPTYTYTESAASYSWTAVSLTIDPSVSNTDLDGGGDTDYFLTFTLPLADLVAMAETLVPGFDESSVVGYVAATATQANTLNQDLNGVNGSLNSSSTWEALGALSSSYTASGVQVIPEPSAWTLMFLGLAGLVAIQHSRRWI